MKIAQIAPIWFPIPPKKYGGTERIISSLAEGLVKKGHEITLFATGDSITKARLVSFFPKGIGRKSMPTDREFFLLPLIHMVKSLERAKNFDIIHCHFTRLSDYILLALTKSLKNCLFTSHVPFPERKKSPDRWKALQTFSNTPFVSISNSQRTAKLNFVANVYNGIEANKFEFADQLARSNKNGYLFWMGRISSQKGIVEAIEVSKKLNIKLLFTKVIKADFERKYFENKVRPRLDRNTLQSLPELDHHQGNFYLKNAKLLLFPIQWEEPFGLVMIESMATGTPVVAFARGSVPEVIKDGETGFIVNPSKDDIRGHWLVKNTGIEGLCEAVERICSMPKERYRQMRYACREHVEKNFTVEQMVNNYDEVYKKITEGSKR